MESSEDAGLTVHHILALTLPLLLLYLTVHYLDLSPVLLTPRALRSIIFGPSFSSSPSSAYYSLRRATASYASYTSMSMNEVKAMQGSYARLGYRHKRVGYEVGYTRKLEEVRRCAEVNGVVAQGVVQLARSEFGLDAERGGEGGEDVGWWRLGVDEVKPDLSRVREAMKHFVRDWSVEGASEREKIFEPVLEVLRRTEGMGRKVLVPGSGLGRLAWEICELGMWVRWFGEREWTVSFAVA